MIYIDLSNKNKSFSKKIFQLLKESKKDIVINSKFQENNISDNIKIENIEKKNRLRKIVKESDVVIIFDFEDFRKYINWANKVILLYDPSKYNSNKIEKYKKLELKSLTEINEVLEIRKIKKNKKKKKFNMNIVIYIILIMLLIAISVLFINKYSDIQKLTNDNKKLTNEVKKLNKINKNYDNYLFLGDSITYFYDLDKYFKDYKVVNSGICGHQTHDIYNSLNDRAYVYNPSKIFLLIGINDLNHDKTNEEIINKTKDIIEELNKNLPNAKVYLESIYPVNNTDDKKINKDMVGKRENSRVIEINDELKKYCNSKNCTYIDLYSLLKDDNDNLKLEYTDEGLHISDDGYEVITKELKKYME